MLARTNYKAEIIQMTKEIRSESMLKKIHKFVKMFHGKAKHQREACRNCQNGGGGE